MGDIFGWWWSRKIGGFEEACVADVIDLEFQMYRHHEKNVHLDENDGTLHSMLYSLAQQVVRQDPYSYLLHVCYRPDHEWRLVSLPCFAFFAVPGSVTGISRVDIPMYPAVEIGQGTSMVAGTAVFDAEDEENCAIAILGLHAQAKTWLEQMKEKGQDREGFIDEITPEMYGPEEVKQFHA